MSGIHVVYVVNDQAPQFCPSAEALFVGPSSYGCCLPASGAACKDLSQPICPLQGPSSTV